MDFDIPKRVDTVIGGAKVGCHVKKCGEHQVKMVQVEDILIPMAWCPKSKTLWVVCHG